MTSGHHKFLLGQIYMMKFEGVGSAQRGVRPGVLFQNNIGNRFSPDIVAFPVTTALKKARDNQVTHVFVTADSTGLRSDSVILCECPSQIPKTNVFEYVGMLQPEDMKRVAEASILASSAIMFLDIDDVERIKKIAAGLNR